MAALLCLNAVLYLSILGTYLCLYFKHENVLFRDAHKTIHDLVEDGIEKSVPHDHHLSSHGKHPNANRESWEQIALAKAGLVMGPLRPSVCQSVRNTLGCQVCVICNSKSFHSF